MKKRNSCTSTSLVSKLQVTPSHRAVEQFSSPNPSLGRGAPHDCLSRNILKGVDIVCFYRHLSSSQVRPPLDSYTRRPDGEDTSFESVCRDIPLYVILVGTRNGDGRGRYHLHFTLLGDCARSTPRQRTRVRVVPHQARPFLERNLHAVRLDWCAVGSKRPKTRSSRVRWVDYKTMPNMVGLWHILVHTIINKSP